MAKALDKHIKNYQFPQKLQQFLSNIPQVVKDCLGVAACAFLSRVLLIGLVVILQNGFERRSLANYLVQWDGKWYEKIVEQGYYTNFPEVPPDDPLCNQGDGYCQRSFAFFPVYPLLVKGFSQLSGIGSAYSGLIVSNCAFTGAAVVLFLLARKMFDRKTAVLAVVALFTFPAGYIFSGFMTESLFLFLLLLTYYFALQYKWIPAGLSAALLSGTRNTGVLIIFSFILIYLTNKKVKRVQFLIALLLAPLGLILFMVYLNQLLGDPIAFIHIQEYWARLPFNPLLGFFYAFINWRASGSVQVMLYNILYFVYAGMLTSVATIKKKLPLSLSILFIWLLVPLTTGSTTSMPRYVAVIFPIYIALALLTRKYRILGFAIMAVSAILLVVLMYLYTNESWVTV